MADFRSLINCRLLIAGLLAIVSPSAGLHPTDVADAAKARDAAAVRALLKTGADVNAAQGDGMTALHWAATNGDAALDADAAVGGREHPRDDDGSAALRRS